MVSLWNENDRTGSITLDIVNKALSEYIMYIDMSRRPWNGPRYID